MQIAIFPMKVMRFSSITTGAHAKSRNGKPADRPIDLVGADSGKDWVYAPCDLICLRVYSAASHGLWFRSLEKVITPSGEKYIYILAEHMSVSGFKKGKVIRQGAKLFLEDRYGNASGNHIHWSMAISDKLISDIGTGWRKNTKGAWVLYIPGATNVEINKALFVDKSFTKTIKDTRVSFKAIPAAVHEAKVDTPEYEIGKTYTLQEDMNVRISYGSSKPLVGVKKWTANAQKHATEKGLLAKGTRVTVKDTQKVGKELWVKTPSGWICGYSESKVYIK